MMRERGQEYTVRWKNGKGGEDGEEDVLDSVICARKNRKMSRRGNSAL